MFSEQLCQQKDRINILELEKLMLRQQIISLKSAMCTSANISTLNQWWSSTFINVVLTLIFRWKWKFSRCTFIDVVSTLAKQRWNRVDRITSIQRQWTNVVSTLKFGWNWKLSRRMFIDVVSTLTKQRWNNIERITSIQCRWPNVVSTLIFGWKWKLNQHMFIGVASTLRKQYWNNFLNRCTDLYWCSLKSGSKIKQN